MLPVVGGVGSPNPLGTDSASRERALRVRANVPVPCATPPESNSLRFTAPPAVRGLTKTRKCCAPPDVVQNGTPPLPLPVSAKPVVVPMNDAPEEFRTPPTVRSVVTPKVAWTLKSKAAPGELAQHQPVPLENRGSDATPRVDGVCCASWLCALKAMLMPGSGPIRLPLSLKHLTLMVVAFSVAVNT